MNFGIEEKEVIQFYLKVALGKHYEKANKAESTKDLYVAALNIAWGPAFSHVSKNTADADEEGRSKAIDALFEYFQEYALKESSVDRADYIQLNIDELKNAIKNVKETEDDKICFGHFQKLFNMAIKWLYCFETHREALNLKCKIDIDFANADCPIDSKILKQVDKERKTQYSKECKWSRLDRDKYIEIQNEIKKIVKEKSKLSFDFKNWE